MLLTGYLAGCLLLPAAAQARVIPFSGKFGPGLSSEDNQLRFQSVARLNATEASQVGRSEPWSAVKNVFPGIFGPKCREKPPRSSDLGLFCRPKPRPVLRNR
jgi:hypothetical protein